MTLARVVSFEDVDEERIKQVERDMQEGGQPADLPATEMMVLHDPDSEKSLVILFFESEDDYRRGDETLNAMPVADTPGRRTSVARYNVAVRMTI